MLMKLKEDKKGTGSKMKDHAQKCREKIRRHRQTLEHTDTVKNKTGWKDPQGPGQKLWSLQHFDTIMYINWVKHKFYMISFTKYEGSLCIHKCRNYQIL
jgi:hypothetical protein